MSNDTAYCWNVTTSVIKIQVAILQKKKNKKQKTMKTTEQLENDNEAKLRSITVLRNVHARRIIEIQFGF